MGYFMFVVVVTTVTWALWSTVVHARKLPSSYEALGVLAGLVFSAVLISLWNTVTDENASNPPPIAQTSTEPPPLQSASPASSANAASAASASDAAQPVSLTKAESTAIANAKALIQAMDEADAAYGQAMVKRDAVILESKVILPLMRNRWAKDAMKQAATPYRACYDARKNLLNYVNLSWAMNGTWEIPDTPENHKMVMDHYFEYQDNVRLCQKIIDLKLNPS